MAQTGAENGIYVEKFLSRIQLLPEMSKAVWLAYTDKARGISPGNPGAIVVVEILVGCTL